MRIRGPSQKVGLSHIPCVNQAIFREGEGDVAVPQIICTENSAVFCIFCTKISAFRAFAQNDISVIIALTYRFPGFPASGG